MTLEERRERRRLRREKQREDNIKRAAKMHIYHVNMGGQDKIQRSEARLVIMNEAHAPKNATTLQRMLRRVLPTAKKRNAGTLPVSRAFSDVWETVMTSNSLHCRARHA